MPRNPNTTYEKVAHFLSTSDKPRTIADIDAAGITTKATLYRLLIDRELKAKGIVDVPMQAKIHGIYSVGKFYPAFYVYADPATQEIAATHAHLAKKRDELVDATATLSSVVKEAPVLDDIEKSVLSALKKHREEYAKDEVLEHNFKQFPDSAEHYYETLERVKEIASVDLVKFRTLILSMFVSSFNAEEGD